MASIITGTVNVRHPETFQVVTLSPGDELPDWAVDIVTNPNVIGDFNVPDAEEAGDEPSTPAREEVVARAKELGVKANGKTEAILARIAEAEAAKDEDPASDRKALEAKATELGASFSDETTDAELELLIASKE